MRCEKCGIETITYAFGACFACCQKAAQDSPKQPVSDAGRGAVEAEVRSELKRALADYVRRTRYRWDTHGPNPSGYQLCACCSEASGHEPNCPVPRVDELLQTLPASAQEVDADG